VRTSGLPATIIRPSVVLGDALTGEISNFQGFYFISGLFLKGLLPFVPALPHSYIDFVPRDFVVAAIGALIRRRRMGEEVWLTAGKSALRIDDVVDCCIYQIPPLSAGPPLRRPTMISEDTYERLFKPAFFHSLPKGQKRLMERAMTMVKYLNTTEPLPSGSPELERDLDIRPMADPRITLRSSLLYWVEQQRSASKKASGATAE
jgi:thioester reductase-like protein